MQVEIRRPHGLIQLLSVVRSEAFHLDHLLDVCHVPQPVRSCRARSKFEFDPFGEPQGTYFINLFGVPGRGGKQEVKK